jgi:FkbM family methyltransferase
MGRLFLRALRVPRYLVWRTRRLAKEHTRGLKTAARLSAVATDQRARLTILAALPLLAARRGTGRRPEVELRLRVAKRSLRIVVGDPSELEALYEVIVEDEYELVPGIEPGVILDLGSHIGASVVALKLAYPNAHLVAVEPDPVSFARLTRNVATFSGVTCLNVAVGPTASWQPLYRQAGESWGSSLLPTGRGEEGPRVEVCTVGDILARAQVSAVRLVKFDIESSEWDIFPSLARLPTVDLLLGEIHFMGSGRCDFDAVQRALPGFDLKILRADKYGGVIHASRSRDPLQSPRFDEARQESTLGPAEPGECPTYYGPVIETSVDPIVLVPSL